MEDSAEPTTEMEPGDDRPVRYVDLNSWLLKGVQQVGVSLLVTDRNGTIVDVNAAFEKITGYSRQEVLGKTPRILRSGVHPAEFYQQFWQRLESGDVFESRFVNRRKNGELYHTARIFLPISDRNGKVTHYLAAGRDVTRQERIGDQLREISEHAQQFSLSPEHDAIVCGVMETLAKVLHFEVISIGWVDERCQELIFQHHWVDGGYRQVDMHLPLEGKESIAAAVVRQGKAINLDDTGCDPRYVPGPVPHSSELCVPLKVGERVLGVINIESPEYSRFSSLDVQLVQTLANQAAVALQNARLQQEGQRHARGLAALYRASQAVASTLELDVMLDRLVSEIRTLFRAKGSWVLLHEPAGDRFRTVAAAVESLEGLVGLTFPADQGIAGWVFREAKPVLLHDVQRDPRLYHFPGLGFVKSMRSFLAVPLVYEDRVIGVVEIYDTVPSFYDRHDKELLAGIAAAAAIAISKAQLFQAEKDQRARAQALQAAGATVSSTLDLAKVLNLLLTELRNVLVFDSATVMLPEGEYLVVAAQYGLPDAGIIGARFPRNNSLTQKLEGNRRPLIVDDTRLEPGFEGWGNTGDRVQSWMGVPLLVKGKIIGMLTVDSGQLAAFSKTDAGLVSSFANHAAIAVENARLYQDLQARLATLRDTQAQLVHSEKMAALGRLAASIAHEINNPLQSIQTYVTLAREDLAGLRPDMRAASFLGIVEDEIGRISTIVRRMWDFYRPVPERIEPTDVHAHLESILALTEKQLQRSEIMLERRWSAGLPIVSINPGHLKQVFLNMILNAIDAMPDGGTLTVCTGVGWQQNPEGNERRPAVRIDFGDTGVGMQLDELDRVFEPFYTTKDRGSGLGLAISHSIVKSHGGEIVAASRPGKGSVFSILLPAGE